MTCFVAQYQKAVSALLHSVIPRGNCFRQLSRSLKIDVDSQILCDRRRKCDDELEVRNVPTDRSRTF
jgi:hypothetical protein